MKKTIAISIFLMLSAIGYATPTVSNETAKQRYPWGLVDITCKVSGISEEGGEFYFFTVAAVIPDSGNVYNVSNLWVVQNGTNSTDLSVRSNGNYRLIWDAKADLGQVIYSKMVMRVTIVTLREKVQLWKGGPYWAGKNKKEEKPWEYGYYFWWGDTIGYKRVNNKWMASGGSWSNFSFDFTYAPTCFEFIDVLKINGWITASEALAPEHDAAHVHWGGDWRMPTKQELTDLNSKCSWTWTTMNGVQGYLVSGTGDYASNSIFLPCAGYGYETSLHDAGSYGSSWSSVPSSGDDGSWDLGFSSSDHSTRSNYYRYYGQSVRPVQRFAE